MPIEDLPSTLQNDVIQMAAINRYKKKDFVFKEGDRDDFSFYLLEGQIELIADKQVKSVISSGTDSACYALARLQPRQFSAKAKTDITVLQLNRSALDRLMVLEQEDKSGETPDSESVDVSGIGEEESGDWMTKMLQSELYSRLPTANIHKLFALLEPVEFKAGDTVIRQGEAGEHYYIIQEGRCVVSRTPTPGAKPVKLAVLRAGDCVGEEALLTNAKRNATVAMLTDGVLMQLSKEDFINLIKKPALNAVSYGEAQKMVLDGALWLDVRFENEHAGSKIEGSINIPLNVLRTQMDSLKNDRKYIAYCDTGGRSSAAAFLLMERGFQVFYLEGGLSSVPEAGKVTGSVAALPAVKEEVEEKAEPELTPDIRASVIETELARTDIEIEEARKRSEGREARKEEQAELSRLEEERKKLEAYKKAVAIEAEKIRREEEARIKKMKEEADKRLAEEKKKLEAVYTQNTREMEKLQRLRKEAEEQIKKEREKLERESEEIRKKMGDADKLKKQMEESRRRIEEEAEKKRAEQEIMEKVIQARAREKLEQERRKLAEEIARTNEELEHARREKIAADAARKAAGEEAKKIIAEYKKEADRERAAEREKLLEEQRKLEEEAKKIQETLKESQKARETAEQARKAAEEDARKLREMQKQAVRSQDHVSRMAMEKEMRAAEAKLEQANKNLANAQKTEEKMEAVRVMNEQELSRRRAEEEKLRKQVEADLSTFVAEYEKQAKKTDKVVAHTDHIRRIKERAELAKKETEKSTDNLFSDIAAQLGEK